MKPDLKQPQEYDSFYNTSQAIRQNKDIKCILSLWLGEGDKILDLGCGTGLGWKLLKYLRPEYEGCDINPRMIDFCKAHYPDASFTYSDAYSYVLAEEIIPNCIALFSIEYMDDRIIDEVIRRLEQGGKFILVHYQRPYKRGSGSEYEGKEGKFMLQLGLRRQQVLKKLKDYGFKTENLSGQNHYYISIYEK